ncbi:MAG: AI-2E family transporter [Lachnospiraceae bacterium]|jgi:predicted PurR-regulated permease PerM|nr:AI-2E family transporter [Lachnospiraceae bacterium]
MKLKWKNQYIRWGLTALLVIMGSIMFYYLLFHSSNIKSAIDIMVGIMMPVVFGFILAYLLTPVLNSIEQRILYPLRRLLKLKEGPKSHARTRMLGVLVTALLFYFAIHLLISMLVSQIVPSIQNIVSNFDTYMTNFTAWMNQLLADNSEIKDYAINLINRYSEELERFLNETVLTKSSELIKTVSLSVLGIFKTLWNFIIGFVISIYILGSKEKFAVQAKKLLYACYQPDSANVIINNFRFAHNTFIGFISGKILDSLIIGLLCLIGTTMLRTPYAALISVIIGVTNIIPFFGPFLGAIPSAVLILVVDPMHPLNCVYFIIFILILQQVDGNLIGPKILGDSTGLSGFWVIFSITLFGGMFNVLGMIVGVPIFAIIYAAVRSYVNSALIKKKMPIKSAVYESIECVDDAGIHTMDNQERRRAIKSRNLEKKEAKSEETPDRQEENLVSGMKFISNIEEWKRRMPVRWDDRNVIAREHFAVPAYPPEDTSAPEKVNDLLKEKDKEK